jgi:hypothetical protein
VPVLENRLWENNFLHNQYLTLGLIVAAIRDNLIIKHPLPGRCCRCRGDIDQQDHAYGVGKLLYDGLQNCCNKGLQRYKGQNICRPIIYGPKKRSKLTLSLLVSIPC